MKAGHSRIDAKAEDGIGGGEIPRVAIGALNASETGCAMEALS